MTLINYNDFIETAKYYKSPDTDSQSELYPLADSSQQARKEMPHSVNRFITILSATGLLLGLSFQLHAATSFRIMTYNIASGFSGTGSSASTDRIELLINAQNPDILCLNEVDKNHSRTNATNQVQDISDATELGNWTFFNIYENKSNTNETGSAILTKFQIISTESFAFAPENQLLESIDRGVVVARMNISSSKKPELITVICTHMNGGGSQNNESIRIANLKEIEARFNGSHIILAGDFNHHTAHRNGAPAPARQSYVYSQENWTDLHTVLPLPELPIHGYTIGAGSIGGDKRDFIYVSHPGDWTVNNVYVVDDLYVKNPDPANHNPGDTPNGASDHRAAVADLTFGPQAAHGD